jgi:hypothetical protein
MEILLYKKTTDKDLKIGMKICYKDINGVYSKIGKITDWVCTEGVAYFLIDTSFGSYTADELKLISIEDERDLFEWAEEIPAEIAILIDEFKKSDMSYLKCESLLEKCLKIGYNFKYDLDGVPYDLKKSSEIVDSIMKMEIGEQRSVRLGLASRDLYGEKENVFEITCTMGSWITAEANKITIFKILAGAKSIQSLNWK